MSGSELSSTGERLLSMAGELANPLAEPGARPPLSEFLQTYREWISVERGRSGSQQEQAERWQLVVQGMISATNLTDALGLLIRYAGVMWNGLGPSGVRAEGKETVLTFNEPYRSGAEGLIAAIWQLSLTACHLEFLADSPLDGARGRVIHEPCLDSSMIDLLFGRPLEFGQPEVALVVPSRHLHRPVVARAKDLPHFFAELLPLTLGAKRESPSIRSLVAGLLHDGLRGPDYHAASFGEIAAQLGMSCATLRRRLKDEGTSFRLVRDAAFEQLACAWLRQVDIPIETIAMRLGYSDGFAFRRFFQRVRGCSPAAYRSASAKFG